MLWFSHRLSEKIKQRKYLKKCSRCTLFFDKKLVDCPYCKDLSDTQIKTALKKRVRFRVGLGRSMYIVAAIIFLLMILFNKN